MEMETFFTSKKGMVSLQIAQRISLWLLNMPIPFISSLTKGPSHQLYAPVHLLKLHAYKLKKKSQLEKKTPQKRKKRTLKLKNVQSPIDAVRSGHPQDKGS